MYSLSFYENHQINHSTLSCVNKSFIEDNCMKIKFCNTILFMAAMSSKTVHFDIGRL